MSGKPNVMAKFLQAGSENYTELTEKKIGKKRQEEEEI